VELFELSEKPTSDKDVWRGKPGASIKDWPRFKRSADIEDLRKTINTKLSVLLDDLHKRLSKHLQGQHDQQDHDPTHGVGGAIKPGKSGFVTAVSTRAGDYAEIFQNPSSKKDLKDIDSWDDTGGVRAILTEGGDLVYWDARLLHYEAISALKPGNNIVPLVIGNNYVYVTDAIKNSFGEPAGSLESVVPKLRQAGKIIRRHKDKLASLIGRFNIDHYGSAIEGDVIPQAYKDVEPNEKFVKFVKHLPGEHNQQTHDPTQGAGSVGLENKASIEQGQAELEQVKAEYAEKLEECRYSRILMVDGMTESELHKAYQRVIDRLSAPFRV